MRTPEGGDDSDLIGRLVIYRSESLTIWEAMELREQGFRISSGNFALTPGEEEAFGTWGGEAPVDNWAKADLERLYEADTEVQMVLEKGGGENWRSLENGAREQLRLNAVTGRNEWTRVVPRGAG